MVVGEGRLAAIAVVPRFVEVAACFAGRKGIGYDARRVPAPAWSPQHRPACSASLCPSVSTAQQPGLISMVRIASAPL